MKRFYVPLTFVLMLAFCTLPALLPSAAQVSSPYARRYLPRTFAQLGTPPNGSVYYCSDCTQASPCASGGAGAVAERVNGAWVCNGGATAGIGGSTGATDNRLLRSDGIGGSTVQSSAVTVDDSGNLSTSGTLQGGSMEAGTATFGVDGAGAYLRSAAGLNWSNGAFYFTGVQTSLKQEGIGGLKVTGSAGGGGLITGGSAGKPTCDSTIRGMQWVVNSAGGAGDVVQVCMKGTADTYAWRDVFTAP